jgi:SAM-dependent methyltransferase
MTACPLCQHDNVSDFIQISDFPLLLFPVSEDLKDKIEKKQLKTYRCSDCNHIFHNPITEKDAHLIYDRYYAFYPFANLESMNVPYRIPFEQIFHDVYSELHSTFQRPATLLEVGCASSKQLDFFRTYGIKASGIDRSASTNESPSDIISGVYEDYDFEQGFEMIVSRFSLEHLNDVHGFFQKARKDLNANGLLFVQVPNVQTFARSLMPLFLAHEHIHYFNAYSLCVAAERHGFQVVAAQYEDSQSIILALRKNSAPTEQKYITIPKIPEAFYGDYLERKWILAQELMSVLSRSSHCHFYGAGLSLCWILYELKVTEKLACGAIIDDNLFVQGKFLPHTSYKITTLENTRFRKSSTMILSLNPVYHENVMAKIRRSDFQGEIFAISSAGLSKLVGQ